LTVPHHGTRIELKGFLRVDFLERREALMSARSTIAGLAGSALLATAAFAQTPTPIADRADVAGATASATVSPLRAGWPTSKLVGLAVYNGNDESLGTVSDLLTDKAGNIKAVVIGVGGLMGVGAHLVAVPFDKVKFVEERISYSAAAGSPNAEGRPASTTTVGANTASPSKPVTGDPDHAVLNATKDELKAMPSFDDPT
jgi:sporulation protein YlmC with PRC-barrel domain